MLISSELLRPASALSYALLSAAEYKIELNGSLKLPAFVFRFYCKEIDQL